MDTLISLMHNDSTKIRFLFFVIIVLVANVLLISLSPIVNTDIWWHLATGDLMREQAHFFDYDPFAIMHQVQWLNVHWIFQLLASFFYQHIEIIGLILLKSLCIGIGICVLFATTEWKLKDSTIFLAIATLLLFFARDYLFIRPTLLTLIYLAIYIFILERIRSTIPEKATIGSILILIFTQILWTNSQGLFLLGPLIVLTYAFESFFSARKHAYQLIAISIGLIIISMINPYGWQIFKLPLSLLIKIDPTQNAALMLSENIPTWKLIQQQKLLHFPWISALIFVSFFLSRRNLHLSHLALTTGFFFLALMANRNILLFYWIAIPIVTQNLTQIEIPLKPNAQYGAIALIILTTLVFSFATKRQENITTITPFRVPTNTIRVLINQLDVEGRFRAQFRRRSRGLSEHGNELSTSNRHEQKKQTKQHFKKNQTIPIFTSIRYGGYLIHKLYPHYKPLIDGRTVLRSKQELRAYFNAVDNPHLHFDTFRQKYNLDHVLLPTAYPDRYLKLIYFLNKHPNWKITNTDGTEILFRYQSHSTKKEDYFKKENIEQIIKSIKKRYTTKFTQDRAINHLARLLIICDQIDKAKGVLRKYKPEITLSVLKAI